MLNLNNIELLDHDEAVYLPVDLIGTFAGIIGCKRPDIKYKILQSIKIDYNESVSCFLIRVQNYHAICRIYDEESLQEVQRQIASALDIIIHLGRLRDKSRKVLQITEIEKYESGKIHTRTLYEFREEGMEHGKIKGRLMKVAELSNQEKLMAAGYKEA